jgi:HD-GYP domain-containing protein (c-di-GMP phosphodiesterase class II)
MRFSAPVYFDDEVNMFLAEGVKLKDRDLKVMADWQVPYVVTDGHLLDNGESVPENRALEDISGNETGIPPDVTVSPAPEELLVIPAVSSNSALYRRYVALIEDIGVFFSNIHEGIPLSAADVDMAAVETAALIAEDRVEMMGFLLGGNISGNEYAKSSVNTAVLSVVIAERLGYVHRRVMKLITGALLHDIGMMCIPDSIRNKEGQLSDDEMKLMKTHPLQGYRITVNQLTYSAEIGHIVLQHHERWNGKGYPDGREGKQIDMGARIVSVADAFEAMVSRKAWRDSILGYHAMKNLLNDNSRRFDPDVLKAFIQGVGIYPIGSMVLLNNGAVCRVIESNYETPLRPRLQILVGGDESTYPGAAGPFLDLMENKSLFITRVLDPKEFEGHNGG